MTLGNTLPRSGELWQDWGYQYVLVLSTAYVDDGVLHFRCLSNRDGVSIRSERELWMRAK